MNLGIWQSTGDLITTTGMILRTSPEKFMKNKEHFVATEASLSFSETIVMKLEISFDKETTKE